MQQATAYLPSDRRRALLTGDHLPARAIGAVLFVDISGFTPLTETLARQLGRSRGAELLTRTLNAVYQALIDQVDQHGGSVIGFAGDAITCWFDAGVVDLRAAAARALAAAQAMQRAIEPFAAYMVAPGVVAHLTIKTALASGAVRRLLVGDPAIQVIDVLTGAPLECMAAAEHVAASGEMVADAATIELLGLRGTVGVWRADENGQPVGVLTRLGDAVSPAPAALAPPGLVDLPDDAVRPWLLPAVWANLQEGDEQYLAELRPAAALFLRFSGLAFETDEEAPQRLDAYIRWVQQVLNRHEGALIQLTTGDKGSYLYAAFGAPLAHDDYAERAIAAALELRASRFDFITQVQIGLSAGMMRVGAYGSATRRTYGVLGDETNMAARLMMEAAPGQILASASIAALVQDRYVLDALGERRFKGKRDPQPVYAVLGVRSPTAFQLESIYPTRPVGREEELAKISDAVEQAAERRGHLVRIEGDAGAGKSHLAAAAARIAVQRGFWLLYGACQSSGQRAYAALRDPLAHLLRLNELNSTPIDAQIAQVRGSLTAIEPQWEVRLPLLGDLFDLPIPDNPTTAAFDARLRREALAALVIDLFRHAAQRQPIFLLIEDMHWLDEADQVIVLALARALVDMPLLLCLTHRPRNRRENAFFDELYDLPAQLVLQLTDLNPSALAALVEERLGAQAEPLVAELVYAHTQGNPFFAEEMIDALRAQGQLLFQEGAWRATRLLIQALHEAHSLERVEDRWRLRSHARLDAVTLGIPDTVQGLVLSRLDQLSEDTRLTLKVATVIGRAFEQSVLAEAHPRQPPVQTLQRQIAELERRDFIYREQHLAEPVYVFKHSIAQDAVYQTLLESQRRMLHLAVAEVIERRTPHAVERLAHHFLLADGVQTDAPDLSVRQRALHYLDAAAWRARRTFANETALSYFERALAFETRWEWLSGKAEVLHILGQRMQEEATLLVLEALPDSNPARVAELWATFHEATSHFQHARSYLWQALDLYARRADVVNQARIQAHIGEIALHEGDIDEAERHYRQALTLLADQPAEASGRGQALLGLGVVLRQRGEYDAATALLTQALAIYEQEENQPEVATALTRLGGVAFLRRNFAEALTAWERALTIRRAIGDREGEGSSLLNIAQAYTSMGDYGAALPLLHRALEIQRAVGNRWWENAVWNALGVLALAVGDYAEARRCITIALRLSASVGDEAGAAIMDFNLAQVERECGDFTVASERLNNVRQWAHANEDREFEAQCLTELALTAEAAGKLDQAQHFAEAALHLYASLEVEASMTTDLATLINVRLARGDTTSAWALADRLMALFAQSEVHQIEYPQRALFTAAQAAAACGREESAAVLFKRAYDLVQAQAQRISDEALRRSYLENVRINRVVVAAFAKQQAPPTQRA
ncbi:MAG: adenylyl cyclase [Chloroflexota bacterium]|nr:MAG: adenylyl cyclase [Chloroflexota bacterium]